MTSNILETNKKTFSVLLREEIYSIVENGNSLRNYNKLVTLPKLQREVASFFENGAPLDLGAVCIAVKVFRCIHEGYLICEVGGSLFTACLLRKDVDQFLEIASYLEPRQFITTGCLACDLPLFWKEFETFITKQTRLLPFDKEGLLSYLYSKND